MRGVVRSFAAAAAAALLAAGCTAAKPPAAPAVFFPPAPDLPRLQYLTAFSGRRDVEQQSSFNRFVVGEQQNLLLDKPYGVAMAGGRIYVCDTNATVVVLDLRNKSWAPLAGAVAGPGVLRQPVNISIGEDGTRYVSDPVRGQVVAYDANDAYLRAYGTPGDWKPVDAVAFGDRLYVADMSHSRIVVFDRLGAKMLSSFGDKSEGDARLSRPSNIAVDAQGYLYVTDVARFQVVKLDREGKYVTAFGRLGDNLGHFARPKGAAVDRNGFVYVLDAAFNNVQIFAANVHLATHFGGPGDTPGTLTLPAKVAIDYDDVELFRSFVKPGFHVDYLVLVTSQFGDRRVNVFGFGREEGKQYPTDEELLKEIRERRGKGAQPSPPAAQ